MNTIHREHADNNLMLRRAKSGRMTLHEADVLRRTTRTVRKTVERRQALLPMPEESCTALGELQDLWNTAQGAIADAQRLVGYEGEVTLYPVGGTELRALLKTARDAVEQFNARVQKARQVNLDLRIYGGRMGEAMKALDVQGIEPAKNVGKTLLVRVHCDGEGCHIVEVLP